MCSQDFISLLRLRVVADSDPAAIGAVIQRFQSGGELGAHDVTGVTVEREHRSAEQRDW
jgi:hypothetical protein